MKDTNKARDKILGFVQGEEKTFDHIRNSLKEAVEQVAVFKEKPAEGFTNGEDHVPVGAVDEFQGHGSSPVVGIFSATGRAELGMAAKRNKLKCPTMGTAIHGPTVRGITAVDHFFNIFQDNRSRLYIVFNNLIIIFKHFLYHVHEIIMR